MRLNKYIVELGICSRRKADELIASGFVKVNHNQAQLGILLNENDLVEIKDYGKFVFQKQNKEKIYIALNKAKSYVTSFASVENNLNDILIIENFLGDKKVFDKISKLQLHYAGRLDKESSGLLLLTNDGDLSYQLTHPKYQSEKEYLVDLKNDVNETELKKLRNGVKIDPEQNNKYVITNPCFIEKIEPKKLRFILKQGYKRQIRLMVRAINNEVKELKRIRIANIALKEYENFIEEGTNSPYTNMVILKGLNQNKFCLVDAPKISYENSNQ